MNGVGGVGQTPIIRECTGFIIIRSALFIFLLIKSMNFKIFGRLLENHGWLQTLLRQSKLSLDLSKDKTCRGEMHDLWPH